MAIENGAEPVQLLVSVAVTVKLNVPVAVGVPLIVPFEASDRPVGNVPPVTAKVNDPLPPVAVTLWPVYAVPIAPAGNEPPPLRLTLIAGSIVTLAVLLAEQPLALVTVSVRCTVPEAFAEKVIV